jgi:hypothetical protein
MQLFRFLRIICSRKIEMFQKRIRKMKLKKQLKTNGYKISCFRKFRKVNKSDLTTDFNKPISTSLTGFIVGINNIMGMLHNVDCFYSIHSGCTMESTNNFLQHLKNAKYFLSINLLRRIIGPGNILQIWL